MSPTKVLLGQMLVVFAIVAAACSLATQSTAAALGQLAAQRQDIEAPLDHEGLAQKGIAHARMDQRQRLAPDMGIGGRVKGNGRTRRSGRSVVQGALAAQCAEAAAAPIPVSDRICCGT